MPANHNYLFLLTHVFSRLLVPGFTLGRRINHSNIISTADQICCLVQGFKQRFSHHHHPTSTAKRSIIDLPVIADSKFPEVNRVQFNRTFLHGLSKHAVLNQGVNNIRDRCYDSNLYQSSKPSIGTIIIIP